MTERRPSEHKAVLTRVILAFATFFEKALDVLKPPIMKFFVVLAVTVLLYLLLERNVSQNLGPVLLVAVILVFAILVFALEYIQIRFRYAQQTEEQLKKALRDVVMELQEEKMGQIPSPDIRITYVEYDPPEDDVRGEFVKIVNSGRTAADMANWTLCDEANHRFMFPTFILRPGAYVRVWTKDGANTVTDLYWGTAQAVWNKTGDCAYLRDSAGRLIATYRY
jgi:ABC-type multidrug transport system fused ATPase/permease subunit